MEGRVESTRVSMSLLDTVYALEELAAGRIPATSRVVLGILALDHVLRPSAYDQDLLEAGATLELFLARGGTPARSAKGRARAAVLAAAARKAAETR